MLVCITCERDEDEVKITKKTMLCLSCYYVKYREDNKEKLKEKKKIYRENYLKNNKEKLKIQKSKYYNDNKEYIKTKNSEYYVNNKESIRLKNNEYKESNIDFIKGYKREYYENNKDKIKLNTKEYRLNNKDKINERQRNRLKNDNLYRLSQYTRNMINRSFTTKSKKSSRTSEILGCSFEDYKLYLEHKFEDWMTWDNHGKYNGELNYGWDIDHIIPISSAETEEEIIKLNHYTNLQPLCSKVNRDIKKDNLTY